MPNKDMVSFLSIVKFLTGDALILYIRMISNVV